MFTILILPEDLQIQEVAVYNGDEFLGWLVQTADHVFYALREDKAEALYLLIHKISSVTQVYD